MTNPLIPLALVCVSLLPVAGGCSDDTGTRNDAGMAGSGGSGGSGGTGGGGGQPQPGEGDIACYDDSANGGDSFCCEVQPDGSLGECVVSPGMGTGGGGGTGPEPETGWYCFDETGDDDEDYCCEFDDDGEFIDCAYLPGKDPDGGTGGAGGSGGDGGTAGAGGNAGDGGSGTGGSGGDGGSAGLTPGLWTAEADGSSKYQLCFFVADDGKRLVSHASCNLGGGDSSFATVVESAAGGDPVCDQGFTVRYGQDVPIQSSASLFFYEVRNYQYDSGSPGRRARFSGSIGVDGEAPGNVNVNLPCDIAFTARPAE